MDFFCNISAFEYARRSVIATERNGHFLEGLIGQY